jgi:hypothetical protein
MLEKLKRPLPGGWEEQRALFQTFVWSDVSDQVQSGVPSYSVDAATLPRRSAAVMPIGWLVPMLASAAAKPAL